MDQNIIDMIGKKECFLCGRRAEFWEEPAVIDFYDCPSCGGYGVTWDTTINYAHHNYDRYFYERQKASHLAAERNIRKEGGFVLSSEDIDVPPRTVRRQQWPFIGMDTFLKGYPKEPLEILKRTLLNLSALDTSPGLPIVIKRVKTESYREPNRPPIIYDRPERCFTFSYTWQDSMGILDLLAYEGFLRHNKSATSNMHSHSQEVHILLKGYERISELKAAGDLSEEKLTHAKAVSGNSTFYITAPNGQVNVADRGATLTANQYNGINAKELISLIDAIRQASPADISDEDSEILHDNLERIEQELKKPEPKKGIVKNLINGLKAIGRTVEYGAAVTALYMFVAPIFGWPIPS